MLRVFPLVVLLAACGRPPTSGTLEGVITAVSERSVAVRPVGGGDVKRFVNESDVPELHLRTHMSQKWPVVVRWKLRGERRVAERIDDASAIPAASPAPGQ